MQFEHLTTIPLDLTQQLQWIWYSAETSSFIVGDQRVAFVLPEADLDHPVALKPARILENQIPVSHPCNLPIPDSLYDEFRQSDWNGFRFLPAESYDRAFDDEGRAIGDLLRTLVFDPDHGHYVLHPPSGLILALRLRTIELFQETSEGFTCLDSTRTRGRVTLRFTGHPSESLIAYGDNHGNFHTQRFSADGFGKATKIASKKYPASALRFIDEGRTLLIGGRGYLTALTCENEKFQQIHEIEIAVRDFTWIGERRILFVNQGLHGVTVHRYDETGFTKLGAVKPGSSVQKMVISSALNLMAVTAQHSPEVNVYQIQED